MAGFIESMAGVDPDGDDARMLFAAGFVVTLAIHALRDGDYDDEMIAMCDRKVRHVPQLPLRRILDMTLEAIRSGVQASILRSIGAVARELFERRHLHAVAALYEAVAEVPGIDMGSQAIALRQHGLLQRLLGHYEQSVLVYSHCRTLARKIGDVELALTARLGEASAFTEMGELDYAETIVAEVRADTAVASIRRVEAAAISQEATIAGLRGQYERAAERALAAMRVARDACPDGPCPEYDRYRTLLANAYAGMGCMPECLTLAVELWRESREPHVRSSAALLIVRHALPDHPTLTDVLQWFDRTPTLPAGDAGELAEIIATRGLLAGLGGIPHAREASAADPATPARTVGIRPVIVANGAG